MSVELFKAVWVPLLVALLSLLGTVGTLAYNARAARLHENYKRKEERYSNLVKSLSGFHVGGTKEDKTRFLNELDLCWLYCSDDVIRSAYAFLGKVHTGAESAEEDKTKALGAFMVAVRKDLLSRSSTVRTNLTAQDFKVLRAN